MSSWVAGNEVIAKNVNANIPVSYRGFFCLSWFSFASLPQLNPLIQIGNGLIQFLCKNEDFWYVCMYVCMYLCIFYIIQVVSNATIS